jgi:virginiamycin B lyase
MWFTEFSARKIGRITSAGDITEYGLPRANGNPYGIVWGPDGAVWFTLNTNIIGRMTTTGTVTQFTLSKPQAAPLSIASGPDGNLWFTELTSQKIGRITPAGVITEFSFSTPGNRSPFQITAGPDGALWFTESSVPARIGRISTAGQIVEYTVPSPNSSETMVEGIASGPDGALWFTIYNPDAPQLGRITTDGTVTEYPFPPGSSTPNATAYYIATGPGGQLWFPEELANKIGEGVLVTAGLTVTPASGSYRTPLTFSGSGFAPGENVRIYVGGVGSPVLAAATAGVSGGFTVSAASPPSPEGPRLFLGMGQTSGSLGAASFTVSAARLVLSPNTGLPGSAAVVSGFGFSPFEGVDIYWENLAPGPEVPSSRVYLGPVTTDSNGSFTGSGALPFTVPASAPPGKNVVQALGTGNEATGSFTVQ